MSAYAPRSPGAGKAPAVPDTHWDDVVIGAGSCGATLAARLSEDADRRVLLVEAGGERLSEPDASAPLGMSVLSGHNWEYAAFVGATPRGREAPYSVGKLLGGSSAVNGAIALRGLPADFDSWATSGCPEWGWDAVLPFFRALEADADFDGPEHGTEGPVPVRRPAPEALDPAAAAFLESCHEQGMEKLADMNAGGGTGAGPMPSNARDGRRVSTADAYLAPAAGRPNLHVRTRTHANRLLFAGTRVTGVEIEREGRAETVHADRVTLCAGGVNSPLLLERSGIGDARHLSALGIAPLADLPGVGSGLAEHPAIVLWAQPKPSVCRKGAPWHQVMARIAARGAHPDLGVFLASNVTDDTIREVGAVTEDRIALAVSAVLFDSGSRGSVHLSAAGPEAAPVIALGLASDEADIDRLAAGARLVWSLLSSPAMSRVVSNVLLWSDALVADERRLRRAVTRFVTPMGHASGTARMGPADDGMSVVDQRCRVHGLDNLRVVDASVMPAPLRATPNLSCIMLAERVASWLA